MSKQNILPSQTQSKTKQGYFNGTFTENSLKAAFELYPILDKKNVAKGCNISEKTLNKAMAGENISNATRKKITKGLNENLNSEKQIALVNAAKHLKRYGGLSDAAKEKILNDAANKYNAYSKVLNQMDFLMFKIMYENNQNAPEYNEDMEQEQTPVKKQIRKNKNVSVKTNKQTKKHKKQNLSSMPNKKNNTKAPNKNKLQKISRPIKQTGKRTKKQNIKIKLKNGWSKKSIMKQFHIKNYYELNKIIDTKLPPGMKKEMIQINKKYNKKVDTAKNKAIKTLNKTKPKF